MIQKSEHTIWTGTGQHSARRIAVRLHSLHDSEANARERLDKLLPVEAAHARDPYALCEHPAYDIKYLVKYTFYSRMLSGGVDESRPGSASEQSYEVTPSQCCCTIIVARSYASQRRIRLVSPGHSRPNRRRARQSGCRATYSEVQKKHIRPRVRVLISRLSSCQRR